MKATLLPMLSILMIFLLLSTADLSTAASLPKITQPVTDSPAPVKLLRDDPLLQTLVTVEAVEKPLGDVLTGLNASLKLDLSAEQNVADQRVTLHVISQPVYVVMGQLLLLLSHKADHPYGYYWGSLERSKGERPDYQIWRDTASVAQEQAERDYPRRQLAVMLQDMRREAQLPPQGAIATPADAAQQAVNVDDPYNKAFRNLTDDQISALTYGETVSLDPSLFAEENAALWQTYHNEVVQGHLQALAAGRPDPISLEPPAPAIRIVPAEEDNEEEHPDQVGKYDLYLPGILSEGGWRNLNTYDTPKDPDPIFLTLPPDNGPRVNLAPYLAAKSVTPAQQGNLGFTLQALAKAAHINIYEESFLRTSTQDGSPHAGLTTYQGSVPRLIAQICQIWNYHAQPVPGGYLFWSRTWAQDRAQDVPERLIAPWRRRLAKNGTLSIYDRSEIDSDLTWPQVALTLDPALPEAGEDDGADTYHLLNMFGSLTPSEQTQSLTPEGIPLAETTARGQAALEYDFQTQLRNLPSDHLAQSMLKFRTEEAPELNILRLIMSVEMNGQKLLDRICVIPLKAGKIGVPVAPTEKLR